jgi:hypothetical protein
MYLISMSTKRGKVHINSQANEDEQDTFDGSWIELHELNG